MGNEAAAKEWPPVSDPSPPSPTDSHLVKFNYIRVFFYFFIIIIIAFERDRKDQNTI